MKKVAVAVAVFWVLLALLLCAFLTWGVLSGQSFPARFRSAGSSSASSQIYLDQTFSIDGLDNIDLSFASEDVQILPAEDGQIRLVHSGRNLDDSRMLTVRHSGNTLAVSRDRGVSFSWFSFGFSYSYSKVDLYLPSGWTPDDLNLNLASGSVTFGQDFVCDTLRMRIASGDIRSNYGLAANQANLNLASGSIRLQNLSAGRFSFEVASGDINLDTMTGGGEIRVASGSVWAREFTLGGDLDLRIASGDIRLALTGDPSLEFTGQVSSGDINTYFDLIYHDKQGRNVSATVGDEPLYRINAQVTSGEISIQRA